MKIKILSSILKVLYFLTLIGCAPPTPREQMTREMATISSDVLIKYNFSHIGFGIDGPGYLPERFTLIFFANFPSDIPCAREMIINIYDELYTKANARFLEKGLIDAPLPNGFIYAAVSFNKKYQPGLIDHVDISKGVIEYNVSLSGNINFKTVFSETYEEACQKLQNQPSYFK